MHPDFSINGAKGVIAVTGYEGILGYRTNSGSSTYVKDVEAVKPIILKLKSSGWRFASHSYSHAQVYSEGTVSLTKVIDDVKRWDAEVRSLVGDTDIFIGPFGQIFKKDDPRRVYLNQHGFHVFCGVGMDKYFEYFPTELVMNRADIDGYRLSHPSHWLKEYFDANKVRDVF